jgi:CheY-like chemotaxis protein
MPKIDAIQLKAVIMADKDPSRKRIPFILLTTPVAPASLNAAYELGVQGLFQKPNLIDNYKEQFKLIYDYWSKCRVPND